MKYILLLSLLFLSGLKAQWTILQAPANRITGIYFADSLYGWVCGNDGIFYTTNGGDNWVLQWQGFTGHIAGLSSRECWVTGKADTLLHTTNNGNDWSVITLRNYLDSIVTLGRICFIDSLHGWVVVGRGLPYPPNKKRE